VNLGMRGSFMGENGEIPWLPAPVVDAPPHLGSRGGMAAGVGAARGTLRR
jgi:hypothetical protein